MEEPFGLLLHAFAHLLGTLSILGNFTWLKGSHKIPQLGFILARELASIEKRERTVPGLHINGAMQKILSVSFHHPKTKSVARRIANANQEKFLREFMRQQVKHPVGQLIVVPVESTLSLQNHIHRLLGMVTKQEDL